MSRDTGNGARPGRLRASRLGRLAGMLLGLALGAAVLAVAEGTAEGKALSLPEPYRSADLRRGRILFLQCAACHDLGPTGIAKVGPSLAGLPGRKAGSVEGFSFSAALRESGAMWTPELLDAFIERPSAVVAGTTMVFAGIAAPADRAALVRYVFETAAPPK